MAPDVTIYYSIPVYDPNTRYRLALPGAYDITRPIEQEGIAELCAEDFFDHHDGWESSWPLQIALQATEDGPVLGLFQVELEAVPSFSARRA